MQIIAFSALRLFWQRHPQSEGPLRGWFHIVSKADWTSPADIKRDYGSSVDFVGDNRAIFDIAGNKYRLIARVAYQWKLVQIKFVGTHSEYDKINAETIGR